MRFFLFVALFSSTFFALGQGLSKTMYFTNSRYLFSLDFKQTSVSDWTASNFILREYFNGEKIKTMRIEGSIDSEGDGFWSEAIYIEYLTNEKNEVSFTVIKEDMEDWLDEKQKYFTELNDEVRTYNVLGEADSTGRQRVLSYEEGFYVDTLHNRLESYGDTFISERYLEATEVVDAGGHIYKTVQIGKQRWLDHDLVSSVFNDGTAIQTLSESQWLLSTAPGVVYQKDQGYLYNSYALFDPRMCPQGFHVPTVEDIEILYNEINPYGLKVKIRNKVKYKVYPSALTPLIFPTVGAAQVALWSAALGVDLALTASTGAIDLLALSADALLAGPFAGWKTVNKQNKQIEQLAKKYASNPNMYVNTTGYVYEYNPNNSYLTLVTKKIVLPKKYWQLNKTINSSDRENYNTNLKSEILDSSAFHAATEKFQDPQIKLQYNPFPLTKGNFYVTGALFSLFDDYGGFFFEIPYLLPYTSIYDEDYPDLAVRNIKINNVSIKRSKEQMIYLLLEDNGSEIFANQYHFNLGQHSNFIISNKNGSPVAVSLAGISYIDKFGISFWGVKNPRSNGQGISSNDYDHELQRSFYTDHMSSSMSTIRCVAD
jgi:hypothetical protein